MLATTFSYSPNVLATAGTQTTAADSQSARLSLSAGGSTTASLRFNTVKSTTASKGSRLTAVSIQYTVEDAALASVSAALSRTVYDDSGDVQSSIPVTSSGFGTAVDVYAGVSSVNTPAFDNAPEASAYMYSVTFTAGASACVVIVGALTVSADLDVTSSAPTTLEGLTTDDNTGLGVGVLGGLTTGLRNVAVGVVTGASITGGNDCTLVGDGADVSSGNAQNRIAFGSDAVAALDNTCRVGNSSLTGGVQSYGPYSNISDERFKTDIGDCVLGLDFVRRLRPVRFHMLDGPRSARWDYGVLAQQLERAAVESGESEFGGVIYSRDEDRYFVAYDSLIAPLIQAVRELATRVDSMTGEHVGRVASASSVASNV